jgi:hypothetical protein
MKYPFGQDFTFTWFPLVDDEPVRDVPTDQGGSLKIHIYATETKPTYSEARAGTNKTGAAITAWTEIADGFQFVIPAIADPDRDSEVRTRVFWVAINFVLETGGQVQTVIEPLYLTRAFGQQARTGVAPADVLAMNPAFQGVADEDSAMKAIETGLDAVKAKLMGRFNWAQIKNPESLNRLIKIYACMHIEFNEKTGSVGDPWLDSYKEHKAEFEADLKALVLEYDSDEDNKQDKKEQAAGYSIILR